MSSRARKSLAQLIQEERAAAAKAAAPGSESSTQSWRKTAAPRWVAAEERRKQFAWNFLFGERPFDAGAAYRATVKHAKDKPVTAASAWSLGSRLIKDPTVQAELARLTQEAAQRRQIDEDFVLDHWIAMSRADLFDYFEIQTVGKDAGHVVLRAKDLRDLTKEQRQNVRKLKVHNFTRKDGGTQQTIELEIEHKKAGVDNIARFLGMLGEKAAEDAGANLAEEIREAERRALHAVRAKP